MERSEPSATYVSFYRKYKISGLTDTLVGMLKRVFVAVHTGSYYNSEPEMVSFPPDIPVLLWG